MCVISAEKCLYHPLSTKIEKISLRFTGELRLGGSFVRALLWRFHEVKSESASGQTEGSLSSAVGWSFGVFAFLVWLGFSVVLGQL